MKTYLPRKRAECQVIENIKDLCRLCLNECVNGVPIYPDAESEAQPLLATKIMMCVGIEVSRNDELSNHVCLHCIGEINTSYSFRKVCEIAHQRIKRHLHASQLIKYRHKVHHLKTKELNEKSESNEEIVDKGSVTSPENVKDNALSYQNIVNLHGINQEIIEPAEEIADLGQQQYTTSNEIAEFHQHTYLDENIGQLQIVEMNHGFESDKNIEDFKMAEPLLEETHQNNDYYTNLENIHANQNINEIDVCRKNAITVLANSLLVPKRDNSKSTSEDNYSVQVLLAGQSGPMNNELNRIYFVKTKQAVDSADVMECTENAATASSSDLNNLAENNNITNQEVEKSSLTKLMSDFILSRLKESGNVKLKDDAIATCDIGTVYLETSNGDIVEMDIVEEDAVREKRKYNKTARTKKPDGPQSCGECGVVVQSAASLRRHALRHTGDAARRHACDQCGRAFTQRSTLRRHRHTHQEVRPFPCASCGASYAQRGALLAHTRSHHGAARRVLHACCTCGASYVHASGLTRHVNLHHLGKKAKCGDCSKMLADASSLKRHKRICPKAQVSSTFDAKLLESDSEEKPDIGSDSLHIND